MYSIKDEEYARLYVCQCVCMCLGVRMCVWTCVKLHWGSLSRRTWVKRRTLYLSKLKSHSQLRQTNIHTYVCTDRQLSKYVCMYAHKNGCIVGVIFQLYHVHVTWLLHRNSVETQPTYAKKKTTVQHNNSNNSNNMRAWTYCTYLWPH